MVGEERSTIKRPFFTSPDEIYEEEYYEEQLQEKKRRLTPEQVTFYFSRKDNYRYFSTSRKGRAFKKGPGSKI